MSYSAMRADGVAYAPAITASGSERLAYLQKVYTLVFAGVLSFAAGIAVPIAGAAADISLFTGWLNAAFQLPPLIAFLGLIGTSFLVHAVSMTKGWNLVAFFAMSQVWAFLTLPMVAYALMKANLGLWVVMQAAVLTTVVFGGLTAYVLISRKDFSFLGAALSIGFFLMLGVTIYALVASYFFNQDMSLISTALSAFAVILFSGYVLYDTSQILHRYATDMVVPGALALMVDFIILFRSILMLLIARRD